MIWDVFYADNYIGALGAMEAYRELLAKGEVKIKKTKIKLEDYEDAPN